MVRFNDRLMFLPQQFMAHAHATMDASIPAHIYTEPAWPAGPVEAGLSGLDFRGQKIFESVGLEIFENLLSNLIFLVYRSLYIV